MQFWFFLGFMLCLFNGHEGWALTLFLLMLVVD